MLRALLQRNRPWPIGLDIDTDSVRMLQLAPGVGGLRAVAGGMRRLGEDALKDPQARRRETTAAVKDLMRTGGFRGRDVVTALSCSQMVIKSIRLPSMPPEELAEAVRFEAPERLGFEPNPDQLAYLPAGEIRSGGETAMEVILLGVTSEAMEEHISLLSEMHLSPVHIDAEPVALFRSFRRSHAMLDETADPQKATVLVDIGWCATTVVVSRGSEIVFIKSISLGGRHQTEAVASHLGLSYAEATELRLRSQQTRDDSVTQSILDAIRVVVEELTKEISLCLRYCTVTFRGLRPWKIVLTGGEAFDKPLVQLLNEHLGIECVSGRPLDGIDLTEARFGEQDGPFSEWATCAGLAIRDAESKKSEDVAGHAGHRLSA